MTKPLRLYGWELDNPTPEDISPVYTDTATLSKGLPLYDNTGEVIPQSWVGNIDTTNNTFDLMEKREYYNHESENSAILYLYEIDTGIERHYYIKENNNYIEVTNQVQVTDEICSTYTEYYYWHSSSSYSDPDPERYWNLLGVATPPYSTSSAFVGYPYYFGTQQVYFKHMPDFGIFVPDCKTVQEGEDTSSYTYGCIDTLQDYSSSRTVYRYGSSAACRVHNRRLLYNSKYYYVKTLDLTTNKTYLGYLNGSRALYCKNSDLNAYTYSNIPPQSIVYSNNPALSDEITGTIKGVVDTTTKYIYINYCRKDALYRFEVARREPSLDTDILPWEA